VETFHELVSSDTSVFVMFYSPDCPHCKAWSSTWYELEVMMESELDVHVATVGALHYGGKTILKFPTARFKIRLANFD